MKLRELEMHCGECSLIELCGEPFEEICLCTNSNLKDMEEETYEQLAAGIRNGIFETIRKCYSNEDIEEIICNMITSAERKENENHINN